MGASSIVLRFRDATVGVDTIKEHKAILDAKGLVWWGWWKKDFEKARIAEINKLRISNGKITLVDRSTRRMFEALCTDFIAGRVPHEEYLVPTYYLETIGDVFGWFLLQSIEKVKFSDTISKAIGTKTFITYRPTTNSNEKVQSSNNSRSSGSCLLVLSDLHFGKDYNFKSRGTIGEIGDEICYLTDAIKADLDRISLRTEIGSVAITGDFTTGGDWSDETSAQILSELEMLRNSLGQKGLRRELVFPIPGNHDIVRYPSDSKATPAKIATNNQQTYKHEHEYRIFASKLVGRNWDFALNEVRRITLSGIDLLICSLNSCAITQPNLLSMDM
jgi:Calcineurin-like phosphoesterase